MTLDALIMLMGTLVALIPFLGFPLQWDNIILVGVGVFVILLGIIVRRRGLRNPSAVMKKESMTFVESIPRPDTAVHEA